MTTHQPEHGTDSEGSVPPPGFTLDDGALTLLGELAFTGPDIRVGEVADALQCIWTPRDGIEFSLNVDRDHFFSIDEVKDFATALQNALSGFESRALSDPLPQVCHPQPEMDSLAGKRDLLASFGVAVSETHISFDEKEDCARLERSAEHTYELKIQHDCDAVAASQAMDMAFDDVIMDGAPAIKWYPALEGPDFRGYHWSDFHGRVIPSEGSMVKQSCWHCAACGTQRVARRAPGGRLKCSECRKITPHEPQ